MDDPWISMDNPWISSNPFRHQMARHSSWEDFNQTNLDEFSVRISAHFQIIRFSLFIFWICIVLYSFLGGAVDHQGLLWGQLGPPRIILEVFCLLETFSEINNSRRIDFRVLPVTVFDEFQGNRCRIDVRSFPNPRFVSNFFFFVDVFMAGVSLE